MLAALVIVPVVTVQLTVCSSALGEDLYKIFSKDLTALQQMRLGRMGVLTVAVCSGLISLDTSIGG